MPLGFLLKFARKIVEQVVDTVNQQFKVVEDIVQSPIEGFIQTIVSGAWEGDDADRFVEEVNTVLLPKVAELLGAIGGINTSIFSAIDILDTADSKAQSIIDDLGDVFSAVF